MSGFIVHSVPGSPFGRAVLATFVEKSATYQFASGCRRALPKASRIFRDIHLAACQCLSTMDSRCMRHKLSCAISIAFYPAPC